MNTNEIVTQIERGHAVSEILGKLDNVIDELDVLVSQLQRVKVGAEILNEGLLEVKRAYGR